DTASQAATHFMPIFRAAGLRAGCKAILFFASTSVRHIMSDLHNAAVLLMTLPEEQASDLMSKRDPKLVEQVSLEIARTRTIGSDEQERVIKEFAEANPTMGGRGGGLELAKTLLQKALGTGAAAA